MASGLAAALALPASAEQPPAVSPPSLHTPDTPESLFVLAELEHNGAQLAQGLVEGLATHGLELSPESRVRFERAVRAVATPVNARAAQLAGFAAAWNADYGRAAAQWYRSDTGKRLLAMESAAARASWEEELSPFIDEMMKSDPASLRRVKLLRRIGRATRVAEDGAATQSAIDHILTHAVLGLTPEAQRPSELSTRVGLRDRHDAALAGLRMQLGVVLQFVYREASDDDLARQAGFVEGEAGEWLIAAHRSAMKAAIEHLRADLETHLAP